MLNKRLLSIIVTICIIFLTFGFDDTETGNFGMQSPSLGNKILFQLQNAQPEGCEACTIEMLGGRSISLLEQSLTINTKRGTTAKMTVRLLFVIFSILILLKFIIATDVPVSGNTLNSVVILHYIHDKDGKKEF